ncbi:MAG: GNAT family N-acetyltransferase [Gammaproteobacteria bacterium]
MHIETLHGLSEIGAGEWNAMVDPDYPFLRHEWLHGLERYDCLAPHGWMPMHLVARDHGKLVAALPLYLKDNSHGEFVFDYAWAQAYERAGGQYYPKLVSAVPFTPVVGPRVLVAAGSPFAPLADALINRATEIMQVHQLSSTHLLFPDSEQTPAIASLPNALQRFGFQYHWFNAGYRDFDDFLSRLDSKHRKQLRKERREVQQSGVAVEILSGADVDNRQWSVFYDFYCSTFARKWGEPRLTLSFFQSLSRSLPDLTLLLLAKRGGQYVGGAFAMRGTHTLFGRHWGCSEFIPYLHFELCYYRTIDYCIANSLSRLDAGAQGEHKLARGFAPVRTTSIHWLRDHGFASAVADFLRREQIMVDRYILDLAAHSPYRTNAE